MSTFLQGDEVISWIETLILTSLSIITARDFGTLIPEIKGYSRDLVPGIQINPTERVAIMRKGGAVCLQGTIF